MATVFLVLVVVLVIAGLVFGVISLLSGDDPGMSAVDPDGRARPLPNNRSLSEFDLKDVRFDTGLRGYRMSQVDRVLRRTAYDLGYKDEMIAVLEAEVIALREGRSEDAQLLRKARESASGPAPTLADLTPRHDDHIPAHALDEEPTDEVGDFIPTRGTAEAASVDAEPASPEAATDSEPENLPREGSLRRRREPSDDTGDITAGAASDAAGASDDAATDDTAANDHAANDHAANEHAANEHAANEHAANEHAANDHAANEHAANEHAANDHATDDRATDEYAADDGEDRASGQTSTDDRAAHPSDRPAPHA